MTKIKKSMESLLEEAFNAGRDDDIDFQSWLHFKLAEQKKEQYGSNQTKSAISGSKGPSAMRRKASGRGR